MKEIAIEMDPRELVFEELADLPEVGVFEVLDFVRFLKTQWLELDSGERFDRAWAVARRIAEEQDITDQDIMDEITRARQKASSSYRLESACCILGLPERHPA